jgi:hypothetical protein
LKPIRIKRCHGAAVLLCVSLSLLGCGGGGETSAGGQGAGSGPNTLVGNFFPTPADARWIYTIGDGTETELVRLASTTNVDGQTAYNFVTKSSDGSTSQDFYAVDASSVRLLAPDASDPMERALSGIPLMRLPLTVGERVQQADLSFDSGADFDRDGKTDKMRLQASVLVAGQQTVTTEASSFKDAAHLTQTITGTITLSSSGATQQINIQIDSWYADSIGLVQRVERFWGQGYDETRRSKLSAYRVGSLKSDHSSPTVAGVTPDAGPLPSAAVSVAATLSKPVDPGSVLTNSFTVTDSANTLIPGSVQVNGKLLTFKASQSWATGTYTARLNTDIKDMLGNSLPEPKSWTFTVDATAPTLVSVSPANGAQEVETGTAVALSFSKPVDPKSVHASYVKISDGYTSVDATIAVTGNTITLQPKTPLQGGKLYSVSAWGVSDMVGNPMALSFFSQFETTQGMFAYPRSITGLPSNFRLEAKAIGDLNSDGLPDLVISGFEIGGPGSTVYILKGQADGSLAPPFRLDIGAAQGCASLSSLAIGDVNTDGRVDLVIGSGSCGAQVLHQTTTGSLTVGEYLSSSAANYIKIADLDRNGRNALIGVGGSTGQISIWRQDAGGTLRFSQSVATGTSLALDVAVGDINGDGLSDLVAAVSGLSGQHIALIPRLAGGGFGSPSFLSTESSWGASSLAVGDLNGDGRHDIVATAGGNSPTYIAVFYQGSAGVPGPVTKLASFDIPGPVALFDMNGDGRLDVLVAHPGWHRVGVYLQNGSGSLNPEALYRAPYVGSSRGLLAVGDLNKDGRPDIAWSGEIILQKPQAGGKVMDMGIRRGHLLADQVRTAVAQGQAALRSAR